MSSRFSTWTEPAASAAVRLMLLPVTSTRATGPGGYARLLRLDLGAGQDGKDHAQRQGDAVLL
jgi:hypothetical protein